nr:hypothetical protein [uncultured Azospirillum sp.]
MRDPIRKAILKAITPPEGQPPQVMSAEDLEDATGIPRRQIYESVHLAIDAGLMVWVGKGKYRFVPPDQRPPRPPAPSRPPRAPTGRTANGLRARLWRAMRITRKGSVAEIVRLVLRDDERADSVRSTAASYLRVLAKAGYLIDLRRPGGVEARYSLIRDTGPLPPAYKAGTRVVRDRNTGETFRIDGEDGA